MKRKIALSMLVSSVFGLVAMTVLGQKSDLQIEAEGFVSRYEGRLETDALDPFKKLTLRAHLAMASFDAGDQSKSEKLARELPAVAEELTKDPRFHIAATSFGNKSFATHISNTLLGLIALDRNELEKAKDHLIASATFDGRANAVLGSFGPNMTLAKKLAQRGERETVAEYFALCSKFWKSDRGRLERWTATLRNGAVPDIAPTDGTSLSVWRFAEF